MDKTIIRYEQKEKKEKRYKKLLKEIISHISDLSMLMAGLITDKRVAATDKAILLAALLYLINPIDFVPDVIPFYGLIDDVYLVAFSILRLLHNVDIDVMNEYWRGKYDLPQYLKKSVELSLKFIPESLRTRLLQIIEKRG
jgi:uncharacterized membrane protein YkvA (DUF1232 family)